MRVLLLGALALIACASSQPAKNKPCDTDTQCLDPSQPYCVMGTCGACNGPTTCTLALPRCAPDTLTCSACQVDADCSLYSTTPHCGNAQCVACTMSAQCGNPTPVCDLTTNTCRGCQADTECASQVCDLATSSCVGSDTILYAADNATDAGACTQQSPCTLAKAIGLVTFTKPTVRMLPGVYTQPALIQGTTTMTIVATGAGLTTNVIATGLEVRDGADVTIRGLSMNIDGQAIYCHSSSGITRLALHQVNVQSAGYGIASTNCILDLAQVSLPTGINPAGANTTATIDRSSLYIRADSGGAAGGGGISITATNSLFGSLDFTNAGNASIHVSYSTFTGPMTCTVASGSTPTVLFDEDIFYAPGQTNAISGTACMFRYDLAYPQQTTSLGTSMKFMDPKFVDPAHADYHLQTGSPAIDAAPVGAADSHDFDGTLRPQLGANDLGAFEYKP